MPDDAHSDPKPAPAPQAGTPQAGGPLRPNDAPAPEGDAPPHRYTAALAGRIEAHWQDAWEQRRTFVTPNPGQAGFDPRRPKKFVLDMFPYPSGVGLHVGHPLGYIATDIYARYLRMTGHNVLHAMGYDAFGLPAEQYAVQTNTHPRLTTERNIATMRAQMRRLGLAHDPTRSVATTDEAFYRWTQWIFLRIYDAWYDPEEDRARPIAELVELLERSERPTPDGRPWAALDARQRRAIIDQRRLAYIQEVPVNWCPMLGTVLANEEVTPEGRSERGNYPVFRRPLTQWMMRITAYAERLLADLDGVDWPEPVKTMQRHWIGRSEGAFVDFACGRRRVRVFTTRPDTLFGATYLVLAPDHPVLDEIVPERFTPGFAHAKAVFDGAHGVLATDPTPARLIEAYRAFLRGRAGGDRGAPEGDKTGVFTGAFAINPVNQARVPVYIADYVLSGYGTGAIMAVPAHDQRDHEFAEAFGLPVRDVVYDRPTAAMAHFARHALPPPEPPTPEPGQHQPHDTWRLYLADFLALTTSPAAQHEPMDVLLDVALGRRDADPAHAQALGAPRRDAPGGVGGQRGVVRQVWLDALDELRLASIDDLRQRFEGAAFFKLRGAAHTAPGLCVNSAHAGLSLNGMPTDEAARAVVAWLERAGMGRGAVTYKLRDWLFSRQRYWGEPFPIVFDDLGQPHALPESMLPVTLPPLDNFQPESSQDPDAPVRTPLSRAQEWARVTLDLGDGLGPRPLTRETNTMPNWAGSCWYYLRYLDPANATAPVSPEVERYWMEPAGVDLYVGGVEHAVLHLLYARFWHKVLYDLGHVSTPEPFARLFNQGYIQAHAYTDARGVYVPAEEVTQGPETHIEVEPASPDTPSPPTRPTTFYHAGRPVFRSYGKMGKSLKNAVAPDDVCAAYGCDTLRIYEMSMGPLEASKPWNTRDIAGAHRFLQRLWRNLIDEQTGAPRLSDAPAPEPLLRALHRAIDGVRRDMAALSFNTAVAKLIELNNELTRHTAEAGSCPRAVAQPLVLMLAPLAPHTAEELWARMGHAQSLAYHPFPEPDPALLVEDTVELPVSVNGKLRTRLRVPASLDKDALERHAQAAPEVAALLEGRPLKRLVAVPGRMINLVV